MTDNTKKMSIVWFRQDLRLADNPAFAAGVKSGEVLPIYILDDEAAGRWRMGGASRVWLHHSLSALSASLEGALSVYTGKATDIIADLVERHEVNSVYWNRCYEPWRIARDKKIKEQLNQKKVHVRTFNASLLWEPWEVLKQDRTPYRVFTPFYKKGCLNAAPPRQPVAKPRRFSVVRDPETLDITDLELIPEGHDWHEPIVSSWKFGEAAARRVMTDFLKNGLDGYKDGRNFPARENVSRLSPYLHFGEISPNEVWHKARAIADSEDVAQFCSELGWREFSYSLMYHFPQLPEENFQGKFDGFPWSQNTTFKSAWQSGTTGIPIVDAGMRELWQTGYMHNRVRMIVASFLVKNLLIDWRDGARWFWDTLVDADLANNSASWQWVAGSGADAAPYFRIFNPVTQAQKFDPDTAYIKKYVPELSALDTPHVFSPWTAPADVLAAAGVQLGETYPRPIVDLKASREAALAAFKGLQK